MEIGRKDVLWNYTATFLKIASSILLLPFILRIMPADMVGIWTVFTTITAFSSLLDFGFNPSFARNITYVFSGVHSLKAKGFEMVKPENLTIDYSLLKGVISAMRWYYFRMAFVLFLLLGTIGTGYIFTLLKNYTGNHAEVFIAWILLCLINTYNLFTLYYDSLLQGKGLIKKSKQIVILGNLIYIIIAISLIIEGKGLVALVLAQASSVIVIRWLSHHAFFTPEINQNLNTAMQQSRKDIIETILPNAIKIGLTSLGAFMVQRSAIIIGSFYLTLNEIATYGITFQLIMVIAGLSAIYYSTFMPKIFQLRVEHNIAGIKELYIKGKIIFVLTFIAGGILLLLLGEWGLKVIDSKTQLMPKLLTSIAIIISFLEYNHGIAGAILLSKNEVPFFKAALVAGVLTIFLLLILFNLRDLGIWSMIIAPGLAQLYNNWKWPYEVNKQLNISLNDVYINIINFLKSIINVYKTILTMFIV